MNYSKRSKNVKNYKKAGMKNPEAAGVSFLERKFIVLLKTQLSAVNSIVQHSGSRTMLLAMY